MRKMFNSEEVLCPSTEPGIVIVLVHGTFSRNARWTKSGSAICSVLRGQHPDAIILRFLWSGKNSIVARSEAAWHLHTLLRRYLSQYPQARHIVIGHSHGGNIALNAVNHKGLREVGVICLSTPILHVSVRNELMDSTAFDISLYGLVLIAGVFLNVYFLPRYSWISMSSFVRNVQVHSAYFPVQLMIWVALISGMLWGLKQYKFLAEIAAVRINIPDSIHPDRVVFIRTTSDEASGILSVLGFVQLLVSIVIQLLLSVHDLLYRMAAWILDLDEIDDLPYTPIFRRALLWMVGY